MTRNNRRTLLARMAKRTAFKGKDTDFVRPLASAVAAARTTPETLLAGIHRLAGEKIGAQGLRPGARLFSQKGGGRLDEAAQLIVEKVVNR